jgi:hypothetical protein
VGAFQSKVPGLGGLTIGIRVPFVTLNVANYRAAQTGVFDLDIRISNRRFIDVCKSFAAETGLKSRKVEKRINAV